jgi:hypothetical protein
MAKSSRWGGWELVGGDRDFGEADVPVEPGGVLIAPGDVQVHTRRSLVAEGRDQCLGHLSPKSARLQARQQFDMQMRWVPPASPSGMRQGWWIMRATCWSDVSCSAGALAGGSG